jgi:hypothetical protein
LQREESANKKEMKFSLEIGQQKQKIRGQEARIDFSFKREVFFIIIGGFIGALVMAIPTRNYYLANLPTLHKKIMVLVDWIIDIFFRRDVTMLKTLAEIKRE